LLSRNFGASFPSAHYSGPRYTGKEKAEETAINSHEHCAWDSSRGAL